MSPIILIEPLLIFWPKCKAIPPYLPNNGAVKRKAVCYVLSATADRKSTRLNSSHSQISYAVFCLKKKKLYNLDRSVLYILLPYIASPANADNLSNSRHMLFHASLP